MKSLFRIFLFLIAFTGTTAFLASCATTSNYPTKSKTVVVKKKAHPHGGPPGQMKKSNGHPGKRHY